MASIIEGLQESAKWKIMRFSSAEHYLQFKRYLEEGIPEEVLFGMACRTYSLSRFFGNVLLNEGIDELHLLLASTGGAKYDNATAYLGVGNDNTAPSASQTGLIGASKQFNAMEATYPTYASQVTTWRAQYASGEANFAWEEYSVVNASSDAGDNLNRAASSEGTKQSGQVWTLDLAITWA